MSNPTSNQVERQILRDRSESRGLLVPDRDEKEEAKHEPKPTPKQKPLTLNGVYDRTVDAASKLSTISALGDRIFVTMEGELYLPVPLLAMLIGYVIACALIFPIALPSWAGSVVLFGGSRTCLDFFGHLLFLAWSLIVAGNMYVQFAAFAGWHPHLMEYVRVGMVTVHELAVSSGVGLLVSIKFATDVRARLITRAVKETMKHDLAEVSEVLTYRVSSSMDTSASISTKSNLHSEASFRFFKLMADHLQILKDSSDRYPMGLNSLMRMIIEEMDAVEARSNVMAGLPFSVSNLISAVSAACVQIALPSFGRWCLPAVPASNDTVTGNHWFMILALRCAYGAIVAFAIGLFSWRSLLRRQGFIGMRLQYVTSLYLIATKSSRANLLKHYNNELMKIVVCPAELTQSPESEKEPLLPIGLVEGIAGHDSETRSELTQITHDLRFAMRVELLRSPAAEVEALAIAIQRITQQKKYLALSGRKFKAFRRNFRMLLLNEQVGIENLLIILSVFAISFVFSIALTTWQAGLTPGTVVSLIDFFMCGAAIIVYLNECVIMNFAWVGYTNMVLRAWHTRLDRLHSAVRRKSLAPVISAERTQLDHYFNETLRPIEDAMDYVQHREVPVAVFGVPITSTLRNSVCVTLLSTIAYLVWKRFVNTDIVEVKLKELSNSSGLI